MDGVRLVGIGGDGRDDDEAGGYEARYEGYDAHCDEWCGGRWMWVVRSINVPSKY